MRCLKLSAVLLLGLAAPALAQPTYRYAPRPMPGPGAMPPGVNPETGARPGNDIGTGQSLPLSNRASNIGAGDTGSPIAPRLPAPDVGPDAGPRALLMAARQALAAGQSGRAQESLERAETRLLDRDVAPSRANRPDQQPLVSAIAQARSALGAGNPAAAAQMIDGILARMR